MIHYITSKTNAKIKEICSLKDASVRQEKGLFLVEGFHLVEMAHLARNLVQIIALKPLKSMGEAEQIIVSTDILKKISNTISPQGVIGVCRTFPKEERIGSGKMVYLDDIQDPGNVGTIIRSASAFAFDMVILSEKCASVYNEKVISASQGAIFKIKVCEGNETILQAYKKEGFQIVVSTLAKAQELSKTVFAKNLVLVLGNESRGVRQEICEIATTLVKIPINNIDSLNVAVAGGIFMNAIANKITKAGMQT